ncbi:MAG: hypothetical protein RSD67_02440 [Oscillospiraceae bacterium]
MTNTEKVNKSMSDLVQSLSFTTNQAVNCQKYEDFDAYMISITSITTNIKRLVDCGVMIDNNISQIDSKEGEK